MFSLLSRLFPYSILTCVSSLYLSTYIYHSFPSQFLFLIRLLLCCFDCHRSLHCFISLGIIFTSVLVTVFCCFLQCFASLTYYFSSHPILSPRSHNVHTFVPRSLFPILVSFAVIVYIAFVSAIFYFTIHSFGENYLQVNP